MPTVSVVIPTRNRLGFLRRSVGSALAQTHGDLEVVVVDDEPSEAGAEFVGGEHKDMRLRLVQREENRGVPTARNTGIAAAAGRTSPS